jgi:hypothetical protein
LLDPQALTGKYWTWMVGSAPTLTRNPNDYDVNQGSTTTWLEVMLGINGLLGDPIGSVALSDVYRGMSSYPAFGGTIATSVSTLTFFADFSPPPSERLLNAFRGFLFAASASALLWGLCLTALADGLEEVAFQHCLFCFVSFVSPAYLNDPRNRWGLPRACNSACRNHRDR